VKRITDSGLLLLVLGLLLFTAGAQGCANGDRAEAAERSSTEEPSKDSPGEEPEAGSKDDDEEVEAVPVEVAALERGRIEDVLRFSTNLEAESQVKVYSQAKRLVRELLVEEGDPVSKGQLLLRLEDDEQRSAVAKARIQYEKAEREYERRQRLFESELISREEFNDASYELEQLRISLQDAERELSYTEVTAPIAGTVTQRLVNLGDQVQIGQHLFDIIDFGSIVARVFVPEKYLPKLRSGLSARIAASATGGREFRGTVDRISPVVDPQSGTVKVTVGLDRQRGLRPGLYVDVDLVMATHPEAVLVPKRALVYDSEQIFVYRLGENRRVERVYVDPLLSDKQNIEPREGLEAGDRVVIAGQAGLKDDALVRLPAEALAEEAAENGSDETAEGAADDASGAADEESGAVERAAR
jgi:membrane fusion protein (multidrug efflux system)